jgi:hypothetical protein
VAPYRDRQIIWLRVRIVLGPFNRLILSWAPDSTLGTTRDIEFSDACIGRVGQQTFVGDLNVNCPLYPLGPDELELPLLVLVPLPPVDVDPVEDEAGLALGGLAVLELGGVAAGVAGGDTQFCEGSH